MKDAIPPVLQLVSEVHRVIAAFGVAMQWLGINIASVQDWRHRRRRRRRWRRGDGVDQMIGTARGSWAPKPSEVAFIPGGDASPDVPDGGRHEEGCH